MPLVQLPAGELSGGGARDSETRRGRSQEEEWPESLRSGEGGARDSETWRGGARDPEGEEPDTFRGRSQKLWDQKEEEPREGGARESEGEEPETLG